MLLIIMTAAASLAVIIMCIHVQFWLLKLVDRIFNTISMIISQLYIYCLPPLELEVHRPVGYRVDVHREVAWDIGTKLFHVFTTTPALRLVQ